MTLELPPCLPQLHDPKADTPCLEHSLCRIGCPMDRAFNSCIFHTLNTHVLACWAGSGHYAWRIYNDRFGAGAWHFINDGYSTSFIEGWQCEAAWTEMPVYTFPGLTQCTDARHTASVRTLVSH